MLLNVKQESYEYLVFLIFGLLEQEWKPSLEFQ